MANFRIDLFKLALNEQTGKYILTGECNSNKAPNGNNVQGHVSGLEIVFDISNFDPDDRLTFNTIDEIDFSHLDIGGNEWYYLQFDDVSAGPSGKKTKGGVAVKDTRYPPPNHILPEDIHLPFSSQFKLISLTAIRTGTSDKFAMEIVFKFTSTFANYAPWNFYSFIDWTRTFQKVMRMELQQTLTGSPHEGIFAFNNDSVDLDNSDGRAFIIMDKNAVWNSDIDIKKINLFLD